MQPRLPIVTLPSDLARRDSAQAQAHSLSAEERADFMFFSRRCRNSGELIHLAVEWLSVETSARYFPTEASFCNVYAHDLCSLLGTYLPRVWWIGASVGSTKHFCSIGREVTELSTNALYDWLAACGCDFGWHLLPDAEAGRQSANDGKLVIAIGQSQRTGKHGHISIILPERGALISDRLADRPRYAQSEAGRTNIGKRLVVDWWREYPNKAFWEATVAPQFERNSNTQFQRDDCRRTIGNMLAELLAFLLLRKLVFQIDLKLADFAASDSNNLSPLLFGALVAAEDQRFLKHGGFDPQAIGRAILTQAAGGPLQGASTIEQQLVRTITGRRSPTLGRKLTEIMLAAHVARRFPKRFIAPAYLDIAYFGWRMSGLDQACLRLRVEASTCTLEEACMIIAALRYPLPREPTDVRDRALRSRAAFIAKRVRNAGV